MALIPSITQIHRYTLTLLLLLVSTLCFSQGKPTKVEKEYEKAMKFVQEKDLVKAIPALSRVVELDPTHKKAIMTLGDAYFLQKDFPNALKNYQSLTKIDSLFHPRQYLNAAKIYIKENDYKTALVLIRNVFRFKIPNFQTVYDAELIEKNCVFAIHAIANPVSFNPQNLGDSINSANDEYLPSLSADDEWLIFTRKDNQEDFFYSKNLGKTFSKAKALEGTLNTRENEGAQTISPDGNSLYYTACSRKDGFGSCDLYVATRKGNKWVDGRNLGESINTPYWESQPSISSDGKHLFFISNRPGGNGGSDIYVSALKSNGDWSIPENLGKNINTRSDESSPYIHPDGKTLYFSSDGHPGMGGKDLYVSRYENGAWQTPTNLGYPINTQANESSLFVNLNGTVAYYAAEKSDSYGKNDIYKFELYEDVRPSKVIYVKGIVFDRVTNLQVLGQIEIQNITTKKSVFSYVFNPENGSYIACLPLNENYALSVSSPGYLFYSENFNLVETNKGSIQYNIPLEPILEGKEVVLKNIFFETDSFQIKNESKVELQKLADFINLNPGIKIEIQGHTDNVGDRIYNYKLSEKRAKAVYDELVKMGINAAQLMSKGFGDMKPIVPNDTPLNKSLNRRTQFKVLKGPSK